MMNYRMGDRVAVIADNDYDIPIGTEAIVINELPQHPGCFVLAWPNRDRESMSATSFMCHGDALEPVDPGPDPAALRWVADGMEAIARWAWPDDRADWNTTPRKLRTWANRIEQRQ